MQGRPRERGTTLIELILAAVVLATMLGAILSICTKHHQMRQVDEELNLAFLAARSSLEDLRSMPIEEIAALHEQGFDVPGLHGEPGGLRALPGDPDGLPGRFEVTTVQSSAGEVVYQVKAAVVWTGKFKRRTFALETKVTSWR